MLIENYELEVFTPPCEPGAERYAARARLKVDIAEVLPYLNATLQGATYHPSARALTWKDRAHTIAFHADEIAVSNVEDRSVAEQELKRQIELVNQTWERRAEITPSLAARQRPKPMDLFKLLPRENCGKCGEATCYSFALKLSISQTELSACTLLAEPKYIDKLAAIKDIMSGALPVEQEETP